MLVLEESVCLIVVVSGFHDPRREIVIRRMMFQKHVSRLHVEKCGNSIAIVCFPENKIQELVRSVFFNRSMLGHFIFAWMGHVTGSCHKTESDCLLLETSSDFARRPGREKHGS